MNRNRLLARVVVCGAALVLGLSGTMALAENIDPDNDSSQFAWGENIGWVNAEPGGDGGPGVLVEDDGLSGYMWGENIGWISLHCLNEASCGRVDYGVLNDGAGNLAGFAWGENIGWVNFSPSTGGGVTIDPGTGEFSGRAWGENVGWITFRSTGPVAFGVTTTWRPPDTTPPVIMREGADPVTVEAGSFYEDEGATASDNLDGDLTGSIMTGGLPVDTNVLGATLVTYDVTDNAGNPAVRVTRTVNVVDTTAPSLTQPCDIVAEAGTSDAVTLVTNVMDDNGNWTLGNTSLPFLSGTVFGVIPTAGTQTMHFNNLLDTSSGTNFIVFSDLLSVGRYTVSVDVGNYHNLPLATLGPIGLTVGGSQPNTPGTTLTPTSSTTPTPDLGAIETRTFFYDITADNLNIGSPIGFAITVPFTGTDTNVAFDNLRIDFVPALSLSSGAVVVFALPAVSDAGDPAPTVAASPASGSLFPKGKTVVTVTATDSDDNFSQVEFTVTVQDTTAPVLAISSPGIDSVVTGSPITVTVQASNAVGVASVSVNGVGALLTGCTRQSGTWEALVPVTLPVPVGEELTFSATATDLVGNSASAITIVDNDGIVNALDTDTPFSNEFSDAGLGGTTTGIITDRGDQLLTITEELNPAGVRVIAALTGGPPPATISGCGGTKIRNLDPGDDIFLTCGSVIITVTSGEVSVEYDLGDTPATVDLGAGNTLTFDPEDNTFTAPDTNDEPLVVVVGGQEFSVEPGETTVVDINAPTIEDVSASPNVLWPPNHKMVPVQVAVSVTDDVDPAPTCQLVSVTSNEPVDGTGSGDKTPDWEFSSGSLSVDLRAERAGGGTGRVYTLTIDCSDGSGNAATATVDVTVPHNQGA